jgi:hypothetical protein
MISGAYGASFSTQEPFFFFRFRVRARKRKRISNDLTTGSLRYLECPATKSLAFLPIIDLHFDPRPINSMQAPFPQKSEQFPFSQQLQVDKVSIHHKQFLLLKKKEK